MRLYLFLTLAIALLLPALMASAAVPRKSLMARAMSELSETMDLNLRKTIHTEESEIEEDIELQYSSEFQDYVIYTLPWGWATSSGKRAVAAEALTKRDGSVMRGALQELSDKGELLDHGLDESGRHWIIRAVIYEEA